MKYLITLFRQVKIFRNSILTPKYFAIIQNFARNIKIQPKARKAAKVADVLLIFTEGS